MSTALATTITPAAPEDETEHELLPLLHPRLRRPITGVCKLQTSTKKTVVITTT
jgi:hypothetical protein